MGKVSIVIPVFNEADCIDELLSRIAAATAPLAKQYQFEVILVDDGSSDGSRDIVRRNITRYGNVVLVELRRNFGQSAALQAGMHIAEGDLIITMDADLQHFPEEIPMFLAEIDKGYDVVCGWRHQRQEGIVRRWPSRVANFLIRRMTGLENIHDFGTTFRIYRQEIAKDLHLLGESHRFVPVHAAIVGARIGELPIKNVPRETGKSSYGLGRTLNVLIDLVFLYFYSRYFDRPIRIFGKASLLLFAVATLISLALIAEWLITGRPIAGRSGWANLAMFLAAQGVMLLLIGLISEVLVRTFYASTDTTHYRLRNLWVSGALKRDFDVDVPTHKVGAKPEAAAEAVRTPSLVEEGAGGGL
jgi:dolichol-phosphate mannosyltransferase